MSELTDRVRRMLSQAQVFVRDTPFEAVTRTRQALEAVDAALAALSPSATAEREALARLRTVVLTRLAKYEQALEAWTEQVRGRAALYNRHERERIEQPIPGDA